MLIFIILFYLLLPYFLSCFNVIVLFVRILCGVPFIPFFILKSLSCLYLYKIIYIFAT